MGPADGGVAVEKAFEAGGEAVAGAPQAVFGVAAVDGRGSQRGTAGSTGRSKGAFGFMPSWDA
jgi:hypothetical protein